MCLTGGGGGYCLYQWLCLTGGGGVLSISVVVGMFHRHGSFVEELPKLYLFCSICIICKIYGIHYVLKYV